MTDNRFLERLRKKAEKGLRGWPFANPTSNCLIGEVEPALGEQLLDVSVAQGEAEIQPNRVLDDLRLKFGPLIARRLRRRRPRPTDRWHLDKMVVRIAGKRMYLWRAVDHEGEVLDMLVQRRRDSRAALRLMRKLLKKQGFAPKLLVTDKLRSYASAFR